MKVLFVENSFPDTNADDVIFPFGYASLGAVLQRAGHRVEYVFPTANRLNMQTVIDYIAKTDANLICIGSLLPGLPAVIKFLEMIKSVRYDLPVVLGGPMVTYTPELVLKKTGADFCIAGEGEIALRKLVDSLCNGTDYSNIPGLVYQRNGQMINNGRGEVMPFEEIPMPNWDDFPMDYYLYSDWYLPKWSRTKKERVFSWMISRGCPMKCNFCASGCEPRYKTINQSMAELREIADRFDPDYIMFVDNFFAVNKTYATSFCEELIANKFHFKYSITCRANVVDPQLLELMKKSGCQMIFYGLECANNDILKFMKKGITIEHVISAIKMTKKAGIYPMVSIMFGQPGETPDDFFNSLRIALMTTNPEDPAPNIASVMPLLTFPGTGIYEYAKEQGYFTDEEDYWNKYGGSYRIDYIDYSDEVVNIANTFFHWKYHQSMSDYHLNRLQQRRSTYVSIKYSVAYFLKSHTGFTKILSPLLGKKRLDALNKNQNVLRNRSSVNEFLDRCFTELVGSKK